ncbi:MAG: hypothetical protein ACLUFI_03560 [Oscillospiraceae bacterium]
MSIIDDVKELLRDGDVRDGTCDLLLDAIEALSGSSTAIAKIVLSAGRSAFALRDKIFWIKFEKFLAGVFTSEEQKQNLPRNLHLRAIKMTTLCVYCRVLKNRMLRRKSII